MKRSDKSVTMKVPFNIYSEQAPASYRKISLTGKKGT